MPKSEKLPQKLSDLADKNRSFTNGHGHMTAGMLITALLRRTHAASSPKSAKSKRNN